MKFRSKQIHAGVVPDKTTGAILTPIYQSTTFVQDSLIVTWQRLLIFEIRQSNGKALENKLAELEGGADATCYGTGMSAVHCTMLAFSVLVIMVF